MFIFDWWLEPRCIIRKSWKMSELKPKNCTPSSTNLLITTYTWHIDIFYIHIDHLFPQQQPFGNTPPKQRHPTQTTNLWPTFGRLSTGNILTYNAAIAACHSGAQWQRALEFFAEAQRFHLESNSCLGSEFGSNPLVGRDGFGGLVGGMVWGLRVVDGYSPLGKNVLNLILMKLMHSR